MSAWALYSTYTDGIRQYCKANNDEGHKDAGLVLDGWLGDMKRAEGHLEKDKKCCTVPALAPWELCVHM